MGKACNRARLRRAVRAGAQVSARGARFHGHRDANQANRERHRAREPSQSTRERDARPASAAFACERAGASGVTPLADHEKRPGASSRRQRRCAAAGPLRHRPVRWMAGRSSKESRCGTARADRKPRNRRTKRTPRRIHRAPAPVRHFGDRKRTTSTRPSASHRSTPHYKCSARSRTARANPYRDRPPAQLGPASSRRRIVERGGACSGYSGPHHFILRARRDPGKRKRGRTAPRGTDPGARASPQAGRPTPGYSEF